MVDANTLEGSELNQKDPVRNGRSKLSWAGWVLAGVGAGAIVSYLIARIASSSNEQRKREIKGHVVDDRGTGQHEASQILRNLRDRAFDSSDEKLAMALGRPQQEVEAWNVGQEPIDDDVIMKARGIAIHRGVQID